MKRGGSRELNLEPCTALLNKSNFAELERIRSASSRQRRPFRGKAKFKITNWPTIKPSSNPWLRSFLAG